MTPLESLTSLEARSPAGDGHIPIWAAEVVYMMDIGTKTKASWISRKFTTTVACRIGDENPDAVKASVLGAAGAQNKGTAKPLRIKSITLQKAIGFTEWTQNQ